MQCRFIGRRDRNAEVHSTVTKSCQELESALGFDLRSPHAVAKHRQTGMTGDGEHKYASCLEYAQPEEVMPSWRLQGGTRNLEFALEMRNQLWACRRQTCLQCVWTKSA